MRTEDRTTPPAAGLPRRIAVLGCSGSGKSTLAALLAARLRLPYRPSDAVFWLPNWRPAPAAAVRTWLDATTAADDWVLDGNFDNDRDLLWRRADLIVWLDLPLSLTLSRVLRRNLGWWLARRNAWGQRMTLSKAVGGGRHTVSSHALKRRAYPSWLKEAQTRVVRIASKGDLIRWLSSLEDGD